MADRGMMFSRPMVRAMLDGCKSQTRRIVLPNCDPIRPGDIIVSWPADEPVRKGMRFRPLIAKGDRIWVRETWAQPFRASEHSTGCIYRADGPEYCTRASQKHQWGREAKWKSARYMPKRASRIWLDVIDVRIERLQDISDDDCRAEGHPVSAAPGLDQEVHDDAARDWYSDLWGKLHNKRGERWADNPWVAVISFTVRHGNIDDSPVGNAAA